MRIFATLLALLWASTAWAQLTVTYATNDFSITSSNLLASNVLAGSGMTIGKDSKGRLTLSTTNTVIPRTPGVTNYASAATIIIDYAQTNTPIHVITNVLAHNVALIHSNYNAAGRGVSIYFRGANAATNNTIAHSLADAGDMLWSNAATNTQCLSNGWALVSATVPISMSGVVTQMVLNFFDE